MWPILRLELYYFWDHTVNILSERDISEPMLSNKAASSEELSVYACIIMQEQEH